MILDEAHNIENICREAATVDIRDDKLLITIKECKHFLDMNYENITYATIHEYLTDLIKFLNDVEVKDNVSILFLSKNKTLIFVLSLILRVIMIYLNFYFVS